ncbi:MAG: hypothetical protein EXX96DRAFT_596499 [Benjaminiella poitrasii]|nr:MAG: hypothetical protein EXX96DRAFT_596499 [Benjaminiella poitrasii]
MYGGSLPGTPGSAMSVGSSLAPGDRILTVKCSINSIQWNPEFRQQLDQFINGVNKVTTHAYSFSIYIFLRAFIEYENFYISQYINREFFDEVWLSLTLYVRGARIVFFYDSKVNMVDHFSAFYELARVFVNLQLPVYVTIDSKILCQNILGLAWISFTGDKLTLWERVVDLNSAPFRHQEDGVLRFRGTIQTDGVGISIIKKRTDRQGRYTTRYTLQVEQVRYISDLSQEEHQPLVGRCVTVDPGRRDLLYFVQEDSTTEEPIKWRYTKPHQDKFQKRKKYILQEFEHFLESRSLVNDDLFSFYSQTCTRHNTAYPLHRKLRLSSYIKKQQDEQDFIRKLKNRFDPDAVFVIGNCELEIHAVTAEKQILLSLDMNRDLAACLNMLHIIRSLREDGVVPARFSRSNVPRRRRRRRQ